MVFHQGYCSIDTDMLGGTKKPTMSPPNTTVPRLTQKPETWEPWANYIKKIVRSKGIWDLVNPDEIDKKAEKESKPKKPTLDSILKGLLDTNPATIKYNNVPKTMLQRYFC